MKKFSNIIENNNNDYIYSELLAIFYINPEISNFLNSEKNKYLLSSTELNSLMYFEYDKLTINKEIINVDRKSVV